MTDNLPINPDLKPRNPTDIVDFSPITILAWVDGDIKFDKLGDIKFAIKIPHQYRESAFGIWDARNGPLLIRIERWRGPDSDD